jgi:uncharacterized SAM-binding protein YcdF (DUF218 family)
MGRQVKRKRRSFSLRFAAVCIVLLFAGALGWCWWVSTQIEWYAHQDQAAPADAIGVLGAAEYDGRPSPVLRARLDHAFTLYSHKIAPLIITVGGEGGDSYSEGSVGAGYLESKGVPEQSIIAETQSRNTEESAQRMAVIARANGLKRLVVVSDDTHMFRIHAICAADGLDVLTSPRPRRTGETKRLQAQQMAHEILSYTLWRLHLH